MQRDELPDSSARIFWSVISYAPDWLAIDAPFLRQFVKIDGTLSIDTAKAIMKNYYVIRGFRREKITQAVDILERKFVSSETKLITRSETCSRIAAMWFEQGCSTGTLISAATKLTWFLKPHGWTMFDKFAERGVGAGVRDPDVFYTTLCDRGFNKVAESLSAIISQSEWPSIPATKVIDRNLVLCGKNAWEQEIADAKASLNAMPQSARQSLIALAHAAEEGAPSMYALTGRTGETRRV